MDKIYRKLTPDGVQGLLQLRRRSRVIRAKKGKGSYSRKQKHKEF